MTIRGQFKDLFDNMYTLEIVNSTVSGDTIIIGENYNSGNIENDLMYFTDAPVELEATMDDMFTTISMQSASVNIVTRDFVGDKMFANNARSATIKIWKGENIIFDGFVEAGTYDQPFTDPFDEFTINAVDKLSTLQYYKYKDITPNTLETVRTTLGIIKFSDLLNLCLGPVIGDGNIYYDMSKGVSEYRENLIFEDLSVSEQVFVGDDYDSVWNYEEVLHEILQYLNLHIRQVGSDFYIFDWDSIKNRKTGWVNLNNNEYVTTSPTVVQLNEETNAGPDTTVSVDEVFNQIKVTCELNSQSNIIESPLDSNSLGTPFTNKQLFLREYTSWGEGNDAINGFKAMIKNEYTDYDAAIIKDWYMQWLESKNWKFYATAGELRTLYQTDSNGIYKNQYIISNILGGLPLQPAIIGFGSVERNYGTIRDDAPTGYIKLTPTLVISINGNENDDDNEVAPSSDLIHQRAPLAEYIGTSTGNIYSPTDNETTNYLVFSGKLTLLPIQRDTAPFNYCEDAANNITIPEEYRAQNTTGENGIRQLWHKTVAAKDSDDGRYYTRKWYNIEYPNGDPENASTLYYGVMPPKDNLVPPLYEYNYSQPWNDNDEIQNLDILECELIIGNKRLVQYYNGSTTVIQWVPLGSEPVLTFTEDGTSHTVTTFQLGINPKRGDYIIGQEHEIRSNVDYKMNIDVTGFAVPIKKSDALTGQVVFRILGPVNTKWNQITRRHPSFWRSTRYYESWHYILAHTENISISDFKCQLVSDHAGVSTDYIQDDKDLIYLSNETNSYVNVKDDTSFRIITQPTTAEALSLGIKTDTNYNAVLRTTTQQLITWLWNDNTRELYTAEKHYVNQYYLQYNTPRLLLDVDLWDNNNINYWNIYRYAALNRDFIVKSVTRSLHDNKVHLTLTEI